MNKIVKFGGSSLADATQFKKVANIIKSDKSRRFVVPSAPGKRFKDDIKVTDLLYQAYNAKDNKTFEETFKLIKARYQDIIDELKLNCSLEKEFEIKPSTNTPNVKEIVTGEASESSIKHLDVYDIVLAGVMSIE